MPMIQPPTVDAIATARPIASPPEETVTKPTHENPARPTMPRPTVAELSILRVLWEKGPSTVREVHEALQERRTGYNTILKLLQIMLEKGLVQRDERYRSHVYTASQPAERTQTQLVDHLLQAAFGGSASQLVMRALATRQASAGELAEIRELLDEIEGET